MQTTTDRKVSIFVITFNQADFVGETLLSALEQDYDNLEVVVGDDGSTDGTQDVIRDFASRYGRRLVPVISAVNRGITANANKTLKACRGELIAFQGGDDVLLPGKIRKQVDWLNARPDHCLNYHDVEVFDSNSGETLYRFSDRHRMRDGDAGTVVRHGTFFAATAVMARRSAMPEAGFDPAIPVASDWLFFVECLVGGGRIGHMPEVLARYRRHAGNVTSQLNDQKEEWKTLALIASRYPDLRQAVLLRRADLAFIQAVRDFRARRFWMGSQNLFASFIFSRGIWMAPRLMASEMLFRMDVRRRFPAQNEECLQARRRVD